MPCVSEKCLKYPVCKHREIINCYYLNGYANYLQEHIKTIHENLNPSVELWKELSKYFPNLFALNGKQRAEHDIKFYIENYLEVWSNEPKINSMY